jgi:hypothetical protein
VPLAPRNSPRLNPFQTVSSEVTRKDPGRRLLRTFYIVLLATLMVWPSRSGRGWTPRRVPWWCLSSVLDAPVLTPAVRTTRGEQRLSDTRVAGYPSLVAKPAGDGLWPAVSVLSGTVPEGRELPAVRNLAEGFARAGYLTVVPDLPGLTEDRITTRTVDAATEAARKISARSDAENGEAALVGVSPSATLALLSAGDPGLDGKVPLVAGVAPFSNLETVFSVATTSHFRQPNGELVRYEAAPLPLLRRRPATRQGPATTIG